MGKVITLSTTQELTPTEIRKVKSRVDSTLAWMKDYTPEWPGQLLNLYTASAKAEKERAIKQRILEQYKEKETCKGASACRILQSPFATP